MLQNIIKAILGKKKIIGWISAALIAVIALVIGEPVTELKDAICAAPTLEVPSEVKAKVEALQAPVKAEAPKAEGAK